MTIGSTSSLVGVLIVQEDEGLRNVLRMALTSDGFPDEDIYDADNIPSTMTMLRDSLRRLVVLLCTHTPNFDTGALLGQIILEPLLIKRHVFIFLTYAHDPIPFALHILMSQLSRLHAPLPLDLDLLHDAVMVAIDLLKP